MNEWSKHDYGAILSHCMKGTHRETTYEKVLYCSMYIRPYLNEVFIIMEAKQRGRGGHKYEEQIQGH